jgi:hypothetical protein
MPTTIDNTTMAAMTSTAPYRTFMNLFGVPSLMQPALPQRQDATYV